MLTFEMVKQADESLSERVIDTLEIVSTSEEKVAAKLQVDGRARNYKDIRKFATAMVEAKGIDFDDPIQRALIVRFGEFKQLPIKAADAEKLSRLATGGVADAGNREEEKADRPSSTVDPPSTANEGANDAGESVVGSVGDQSNHSTQQTDGRAAEETQAEPATTTPQVDAESLEQPPTVSDSESPVPGSAHGQRRGVVVYLDRSKASAKCVDELTLSGLEVSIDEASRAPNYVKSFPAIVWQGADGQTLIRTSWNQHSLALFQRDYQQSQLV